MHVFAHRKDLHHLHKISLIYLLRAPWIQLASQLWCLKADYIYRYLHASIKPLFILFLSFLYLAPSLPVLALLRLNTNVPQRNSTAFNTWHIWASAVCNVTNTHTHTVMRCKFRCEFSVTEVNPGLGTRCQICCSVYKYNTWGLHESAE